MARQKKNPDQYSISDYQLKEVHVRLCVRDGDAYYSSSPLSGPAEAAAVMRDVMKDLDREMVSVVNLDNHLKPLNYNVVSIGGINNSLVPVQNVFKSAILTNSACVMLLHNHPSGDASPSNEDLTVTQRIVEAGKLLDIPVMDHIIVAGMSGQLYSFREEYPEMFTGDIDLNVIHEITGEKTQVRESALDKLYELKSHSPQKEAAPRPVREEVL